MRRAFRFRSVVAAGSTTLNLATSQRSAPRQPARHSAKTVQRRADRRSRILRFMFFYARGKNGAGSKNEKLFFSFHLVSSLLTAPRRHHRLLLLLLLLLLQLLLLRHNLHRCCSPRPALHLNIRPVSHSPHNSPVNRLRRSGASTLFFPRFRSPFDVDVAAPVRSGPVLVSSPFSFFRLISRFLPQPLLSFPPPPPIKSYDSLLSIRNARNCKRCGK